MATLSNKPPAQQADAQAQSQSQAQAQGQAQSQSQAQTEHLAAQVDALALWEVTLSGGDDQPQQPSPQGQILLKLCADVSASGTKATCAAPANAAGLHLVLGDTDGVIQLMAAEVMAQEDKLVTLQRLQAETTSNGMYLLEVHYACSPVLSLYGCNKTFVPT